MTIRLIQLLTIIVIFLSSNCMNQSSTGVEVTTENNSITINWGGNTRLSGGLPHLEVVNFIAQSVNEKISENEKKIEFTNRYGDSQLEIRIVYSKEHNAVGLSMSPNGNLSSSGKDFIGLLFEKFPGYKQGITSFLFGDWESWTKPVQVKDPHKMLKEKLLFFLWQYDDGAYGAAIPLGGKGFVATLGNIEGNFAIRSHSYKDNMKQKDIPLMALAFGNDPYKVIDNVYQVGMNIMGIKKGLRKDKTYPEVFENIGWVTWNAFGENVSEQKIKKAVRSFTSNNFQVPFLLIDDGWLKISDKQKLISFKTDERKFPKGLKPVTTNLRDEYGIKYLGVWHTMNGYWSGIDPQSDLSEKYNDILIPYRDKYDVHDTNLSTDTFLMPTPEERKGIKFYDDWYKYLSSQGVSFVKVDQQSIIKRLAKGQILSSDSQLSYWETAQNMEANLQNAVSKHFNGNIINCQNMAPEAFYNFGTSAVARNSDDFFPTRTAYFSIEVEKGNAAAHVLANVHNALWFSELVWPDYDMFQSHHVSGEFHAIARAISGGPVYITDEPGKQKFDILRKLVYNDGKIIRLDIPARPTEDCLFQINEHKPFKAYSTARDAGMLAVWNAVDSDRITGSFKPSDVKGIQGDEFAVYDHFSGAVTVASRDQELPVDLERLGYGYYCIVPVIEGVAPIGLIDKYNSPRTILSQTIDKQKAVLTLKEGGKFASYVKQAPKTLKINGDKITASSYSYEAGILVVDIPSKLDAHPLKMEFELNISNL